MKKLMLLISLFMGSVVSAASDSDNIFKKKAFELGLFKCNFYVMSPDEFKGKKFVTEEFLKDVRACDSYFVEAEEKTPKKRLLFGTFELSTDLPSALVKFVSEVIVPRLIKPFSYEFVFKKQAEDALVMIESKTLDSQLLEGYELLAINFIYFPGAPSLLHASIGNLCKVISSPSPLLEREESECSRSGCTHKAINLCTGCFYVAYCSKECQRIDWRAGHKKECQVCQRVLKAHTDPQ
jgi:hypothetical protein